MTPYPKFTKNIQPLEFHYNVIFVFILMLLFWASLDQTAIKPSLDTELKLLTVKTLEQMQYILFFNSLWFKVYANQLAAPLPNVPLNC